jgi:hypothetical protein
MVKEPYHDALSVNGRSHEMEFKYFFKIVIFRGKVKTVVGVVSYLFGG